MDGSLAVTIAFTLIPTVGIIILALVAAPAVKAAKAKGEAEVKG